MDATLGSLGIVLGQLVYLVTAFVLGARLALSGRRSGRRPETLLGAHLLLAIGLAYLLLAPAHLVNAPGAGSMPSWVPWAVGAGYGVTILGLIAILAFNVLVFRPDGAAGRGFAWTAGAVMVLGWLGLGVIDGFPVAMEGPSFALMMAGILATNAWVAYEPLRYHRVMVRRRGLGLADPVVVDRFRLWGVGSVLRMVLALTGVAASPAREAIGPEAVVTLTQAVLVFTSLCGLGVSIAYWLAFRPTRRYVAWVRRRHPVAPR